MEFSLKFSEFEVMLESTKIQETQRRRYNIASCFSTVGGSFFAVMGVFAFIAGIIYSNGVETKI